MSAPKTDKELIEEMTVLANRLTVEGQMTMVMGFLVFQLAKLKRQHPVLLEQMMMLIQSDLEEIEPMTKH